MQKRFSYIAIRTGSAAIVIAAVSLVSALILVVAVYCWWSAFAPFKVTDPYDPHFNPEHFRFEDYTISNCTQKEAMAKLFPVGTKKAFVDHILVQKGGALSAKSPDEERHEYNNYNYSYQPHTLGSLLIGFDWSVNFVYDAADQVIDIRMGDGYRVGRSAYQFFEDCHFGKQYGRKWK